MPFKSKAQARYMFANHPAMAKEWASKTQSIKALPEHVGKKKMKPIEKLRKKMGVKSKEPGALISKMNEEKSESSSERKREIKGGEEGMKKHSKKVKGTVPKTKRGKAQVAKLGRKKKTGGFAKIAKKAGKEYGSSAAGKRVAGAIFQKMVRAHKG